MGYTTDFSGEFWCDPPLSAKHREYLEKFNETRRMKRNPSALPNDPVRAAVGLPEGPEGAYFVGGGGSYGQDRDDSILDYNDPPSGQPGLWCQWTPSKSGEAIHWDGGEKFYNYVEWIEYLVEHFLKPWGYTLEGSVQWVGEDPTDVGTISIVDNVVTSRSTEEERIESSNRIQKLEAALKQVLEFKKNPVRRNQYAGKPDYKAPDWVATKDRIFEIVEKALQ